MKDKSASNFISKRVVPDTADVRTHPSVERCQWTESASLVTVRRTTRETLSLGIAIVWAMVGNPINIGDRNRSSMYAAEAEHTAGTGETGTDATGGQAYMMYSGRKRG